MINHKYKIVIFYHSGKKEVIKENLYYDECEKLISIYNDRLPILNNELLYFYDCLPQDVEVK